MNQGATFKATADGRISAHVIRVKDASALAEWYCRTLGMSVTSHADHAGATSAVSYHGQSAKLVFIEAEGETYHASKDSCYWKIGICVRDVSLARKRLVAQGISVSLPYQFRDIGFLCHLKDPHGFEIELLQETFEENFIEAAEIDETLPLGQPSVIGQITIRSTDIEKSLALYQGLIGMSLLSIQEVPPYGFCLYFLAFTAELPPEPHNLHSVINREWLWRRPYTTLEIQYKPGAKPCLPMPSTGEGVDHVLLEVDGAVYDAIGNEHHLTDPDGTRLKIIKLRR